MKLRAWLVQGRAVLLSAIIVVAACVSCVADIPAAMVGNWVHYEGVTRNKPDNVELFKDGTGVVDKETSVTWKVENKRFVLLSPKMALSCDYKISGNELTLAYDDGGSAVFVRKENLEEYKRMKEEEKRLAEERKRKEAEARFEKMSTYFTDSRDGQKYRAVKIGGKTWMAQNLNIKTGNSWCYGNDDSKCSQYGQLYGWYTATAKSLCPSGWHLPTVQEWDNLSQAVGGVRKTEKADGVGDVFYWDGAGKKLKAAGGWSNNGNGTDDYGFSALPGGTRLADGSFYDASYVGVWWTATENDAANAYNRIMSYHSGCDCVADGLNSKENGFAVRCVRD